MLGEARVLMTKAKGGAIENL